MKQVDDPESAEWIGAQPNHEEGEQAGAPPLPAGFVSATYRAGEGRWIVLRLDPGHLPEEWFIYTCGRDEQEVFSAASWHARSQPSFTEIPWTPIQPPEKILVRWDDHEAFLPLNVENSCALPNRILGSRRRFSQRLPPGPDGQP